MLAPVSVVPNNHSERCDFITQLSLEAEGIRILIKLS